MKLWASLVRITKEIKEAFTREKFKNRMGISDPVKIILLLRDRRLRKDLEKKDLECVKREVKALVDFLRISL